MPLPVIEERTSGDDSAWPRARTRVDAERRRSGTTGGVDVPYGAIDGLQRRPQRSSSIAIMEARALVVERLRERTRSTLFSEANRPDSPVVGVPFGVPIR